jgi:hypothetical protein
MSDEELIEEQNWDDADTQMMFTEEEVDEIATAEYNRGRKESFEPPQFAPMQFVRVVAFGLSLKGRVLACNLNRGGWVYDVQYSDEGALISGSFFADELEDV